METMRTTEKTPFQMSLALLDAKMTLDKEAKQDLLNLQKGYKGESVFNTFLEKRTDTDGLILSNLLLEVRRNTVQIDSLVIAPDTVHLYEIKNYSGEYKMKDGILYTLSGFEVDNPIIQLERTKSRLRQLFQQWRLHLKIEAAIVYVNPKFVLYNADPRDPIVLYSQIEKHLDKVNTKRLPILNQHRQLADKLIAAVKEEVPYQKQLPTYTYEELEKKIACLNCLSLNILIMQRSYTCLICHHKATLEALVIQQVDNFKLLFPNKRITRNIIHDWCGGMIPEQRIYKILRNNYIKQGTNNGTHYI